MDDRPPRLAPTAFSVLLFVVAVAGAVVLLLQPWVTCPDDAASAACPVPEGETAWRLAGSAAVVLAAVAGGALMRWSGRQRQGPAVRRDVTTARPRS